MNCCFEGCSKPSFVKGWCTVHYWRWYRSGDPAGFDRTPKTCSVEGCESKATRRGWCGTHYARWRSHGAPNKQTPTERRLAGPCDVNGCDGPVKAKGLCDTHYRRFRKNGDPLAVRQRYDGYSKQGLRCSYCGGPIPHKFSSKQVCSDRCRGRLAKGLPPTFECTECTTRFEPARKSSSQCCSKACRKTRHKRLIVQWNEEQRRTNPEWQEKRRVAQQRRRARKSEAGVEHFEFSDLAKRDGWRCGICHKSINRKIKHPHPKSVTVDHIVPISKGGSHSLINVQLAHFDCNMRKGAALVGQLRLFG